MALTDADIVPDATYRAKKPRRTYNGYNDRTVIWRSKYTVQYDGDAVAFGRNYPRITVEAFLKWAGSKVEEAAPCKP